MGHAKLRPLLTLQLWGQTNYHLARGERNGLKKGSSGFHRRLSKPLLQDCPWGPPIRPSNHPSSVQCGFAPLRFSKVSIYLWLASCPKSPSNTRAPFLLRDFRTYDLLLCRRRAPDFETKLLRLILTSLSSHRYSPIVHRLRRFI